MCSIYYRGTRVFSVFEIDMCATDNAAGFNRTGNLIGSAAGYYVVCLSRTYYNYIGQVVIYSILRFVVVSSTSDYNNTIILLLLLSYYKYMRRPFCHLRPPPRGLRSISGIIYETRVYAHSIIYVCSLCNNGRDRFLDNTVPTQYMPGVLMKWLIDVQQAPIAPAAPIPIASYTFNRVLYYYYYVYRTRTICAIFDDLLLMLHVFGYGLNEKKRNWLSRSNGRTQAQRLKGVVHHMYSFTFHTRYRNVNTIPTMCTNKKKFLLFVLGRQCVTVFFL